VNAPLRAGIALVAILAIAGAAAPLLTAAGILPSPVEIDLAARLGSPSLDHWLGTDDVGRDALSRILHGAAPAVTVATVATLVALLLGVPAGALAGLRGGIWDLTLTRLMEATAALPALPLLLLIFSMVLGGRRTGGASTTILIAAAIGVTRWASIARYVRGGIWKARVEDYATAVVALGAGRGRLLARHLLPGAIAPALVSAAFGAGSAVLMESALSFLGLGTQPPAPSWGKMAADAANDPGAWWLLLAPGLAIATLVIGFNLIAEGIRRGAPGAQATAFAFSRTRATAD